MSLWALAYKTEIKMVSKKKTCNADDIKFAYKKNAKMHSFNKTTQTFTCHDGDDLYDFLLANIVSPENVKHVRFVSEVFPACVMSRIFSFFCDIGYKPEFHLNVSEKYLVKDAPDHDPFDLVVNRDTDYYIVFGTPLQVLYHYDQFNAFNDLFLRLEGLNDLIDSTQINDRYINLCLIIHPNNISLSYRILQERWSDNSYFKNTDLGRGLISIAFVEDDLSHACLI
jgi:hypothetical protein